MLGSMKKDQAIEYYKALLEREPEYEGVFFAGIKTTGIFCRPTCPARKPKFENCEFFKTTQEALLAGYRPCKRCKPMSLPNSPSQAMQVLVDAVEAEPEKRWKDKHVREMGLDPSTVRRQFKKRFGMTFIGYARARRMGVALKVIREGDKVINAQIDASYESASGFRDAFTKIMGTPPTKAKDHIVLKADWIDTPLGAMLAVADDHALHLLEFTDRRGLEREIEHMRKTQNAAIIPGKNKILDQIKSELSTYFEGDLKTFRTPLNLYGSDFQISVLKVLMDIPYGETRSYAGHARILGNPKAVRAVARANGSNQIAIVIPCHRVIGSDGKLTGYAGGLARKQWLLDHERKNQ